MMPYTTEELNRKADKRNAAEIAENHSNGPLLPGHVHALCACVDCNRTRKAHGVPPLTWQGVHRTLPYRTTQR